MELVSKVGLTSTHSTSSGTKLLEKGWTLSFSGVALGGSGDTHEPPAKCCWGSPPMRLRVAGSKTDSCSCLCTKPQFRVSSLLGVGRRKQRIFSLTVLCIYGGHKESFDFIKSWRLLTVTLNYQFIKVSWDLGLEEVVHLFCLMHHCASNAVSDSLSTSMLHLLATCWNSSPPPRIQSRRCQLKLRRRMQKEQQ